MDDSELVKAIQASQNTLDLISQNTCMCLTDTVLCLTSYHEDDFSTTGGRVWACASEGDN